MLKKYFPVFAVIKETGSAGGSPSFTVKPPSQTSDAATGFGLVMTILAKAADEKGQKLIDEATAFEQGAQSPGDAVRVQAAAQELAFFSTSAATTSNTYSDSLETLAKKQ